MIRQPVSSQAPMLIEIVINAKSPRTNRERCEIPFRLIKLLETDHQKVGPGSFIASLRAIFEVFKINPQKVIQIWFFLT
jgi:hypothetical protein